MKDKQQRLIAAATTKHHPAVQNKQLAHTHTLIGPPPLLQPLQTHTLCKIYTLKSHYVQS